MSRLERADGYLTLPARSAEELGGLRWSYRCDAIELGEGQTLALLGELSLILEGVFSSPGAPPFVQVLNLLMLMKSDGSADGFGPLRQAWLECRQKTVVHRNVGLLIRELCRGLPTAEPEPSWADLSAALARRELFGERHRPELASFPALSRRDFEQRIRSRLRHLTASQLSHWLMFGCEPAGREDLARQLESLPVRVARLIASARTRARLVGASVLVPTIDAALTIPPRRKTADSLPQGGYSDVATRGQPEHLLPGQFALEPDEFVRRFAERELLYFRREEPHTARQPERVIILDQGVRTWGSVRLALTAAVLSLLRCDPRRMGLCRLYLSSTGGPVDVAGADLNAVADQLESSDLTADPSAALNAAVQEPSEGPRDLILLTHPRAMKEPAVTAAVRDLQPTDRLFALVVDETGRVELSEWTQGGPNSLRTFRVDLAAAESATPIGQSALLSPAGTYQPWTGDVEPIAFPYRVGMVAPASAMGFDASGEWLVTVGRNGILHAVTADGAPPEVLPRAYSGGEVLKQVDAILGVNDGVVVCGRIASRGKPGQVTLVSPSTPVMMSGGTSYALTVEMEHRPLGELQFVAAHYDRLHRRVTTHFLGPAQGTAHWSAFPELHCVVVRTQFNGSASAGCAIDLATHFRHAYDQSGEGSARALEAFVRSIGRTTPPYHLSVLMEPFAKVEVPERRPLIRVQGNEIHVVNADSTWEPFTPRRDGQPLLAGAQINNALLAGDVLALTVSHKFERKMYFFRGPDGTAAGAVHAIPRSVVFTLSPDGKRLAFQRARQEVVIKNLASGDQVFAAGQARLHDAVDIEFDARPFRLVVRIGGFVHSFCVAEDCLLHVQGERGRANTISLASSTGLLIEYDPSRFPGHRLLIADTLWAAADRLGQVVIGSRSGALVATFLVRRDQAAAWIPGSVFWGEASLIGGPPTPGAERKIAQAIQAAGG